MNQGVRRTTLLFAAALCLGGCSGHLLDNLARPAASQPSGNLIDPAFVATLNGAPASAAVAYTRPDGTKLMLILSQPYASARGLTCRIGRDDADQMEYGFCRNNAGWFAVPPRAMTGR